MEQSKEPIQGPLRIGLHDDGVAYHLQRRQKISKVVMFDGIALHGYTLPAADARQLQQMAVNGFMNRVEFQTRNIARDRNNLIDLSKLMTYGMLYRQFDARIWDIIMDSNLTNLWNRQFPKVAIGFGMNVRSAGVMAVIKKNEAEITAFKQGLLKSVQARIVRNESALEDEKKKKMYLAIRYLNMVDPVVWLLLTVYRERIDAQSLLQELRTSLEVYLDRSETPEYLALMLIEMIIIVGGIMSQGGGSAEAAMGHEAVNISMEFSEKKREKNERTKMKIHIIQQNQEFESLRERVDSKSNINLREKSLDNFFTAGYGAEVMNKDLGLYYLSYLKDACKKMDINFESFVNYIPSTKQSLMNLNLIF
ncbi:hypothetical protein [Salinispira pacifica]|uniref:hypothetical protein n=1 Tax=Salinispira pacifica TaxID=1307761 RepID=UPI00059E9C33|nr:hypothetical protein [Salinispira pacifica]